MSRRIALIATVSLVATACAGSYPDGRRTGPQTAGTAGPDSGADRPVDLTKLAMPYRILRAHGGSEVPADTFYGELARADAICVGERHTDPHDHWAQHEILAKVSEHRAGGEGALGMEMVQRAFQGVLDDYAAARIDRDALYTRTGWFERWGHDFALYVPIIDLARSRGMALVALNISNELRRQISRDGMESLTASERAQLPELDLEDEDHRAWFERAMEAAGAAHGHHGHATGQGHGSHRMPPGHGHQGKGDGRLPPGHVPIDPQHPDAATSEPPPNDQLPPGHVPIHGPGEASAHPTSGTIPSPLYVAQVLWDETMAETASRWLGAGAGRQIIILAGKGHCHESAIARRMKRRGVAHVVTIRPILDDGDGDVAAELARPETDYLFVMSPR